MAHLDCAMLFFICSVKVILNSKIKKMATKNEKLIGTLLGVGIGGFIAKSQQKNEEINVWLTLKGILLGGISGYGLAAIFGSPNDTVNYTHYFKGKRVYEGITYTDRFKKRMAEHKASGKLFTRVVIDKPRIEALKLEKERIKAFLPVNNIQHNNNSNI